MVRKSPLARRPSGSVATTRTREGTTVTYVITQACVDVLDKACIDECPVDCIYEGDRMLYIHPDAVSYTHLTLPTTPYV